MTALQIFLLVCGILLVVLLVVVRAITLTPERISSFELRRRSQEDDKTVKSLKMQLALLPRLVALRHLLEVILYVTIVILNVTLFGWAIGGIVAVALLIISDMASTRRWVRAVAQKRYKTHEPRLFEIVAKWKWLGILGTVDMVTEDVFVVSKPELLDLIDRSGNVLTQDEKQHLKSTLLFNEIIVKDIMTPRSMIDSIDQRESIGPLVLDQLHKTGHSRFPVIDGDIDHVVGMLYLHDLVTLNSSHRTAKGAMQTNVYYVREDHDLQHALHAFLRTHHHLFIVVNEFRETVGLLSLEDVIESLLGRQVIDEFDEYHDIRKVAALNPRRSNEPKGKINV